MQCIACPIDVSLDFSLLVQFHGHQELVFSLAKSHDLIYALKLRVSKRQKSLQDFFLSNIPSDTGIVAFTICMTFLVNIDIFFQSYMVLALVEASSPDFLKIEFVRLIFLCRYMSL